MSARNFIKLRGELADGRKVFAAAFRARRRAAEAGEVPAGLKRARKAGKKATKKAAKKGGKQ